MDVFGERRNLAGADRRCLVWCRLLPSLARDEAGKSRANFYYKVILLGNLYGKATNSLNH
jgi:hypothetical protein